MLKEFRNKLRGGRLSPSNNASVAAPSSSQSASVSSQKTSSYGLELLHDESAVEPGPDQYPVDVIAVHGLNGNALTTWTHENRTMWIRDILPSYIPGCRVYTYGYPSQTAFSSSLASVKDFSRGLLGSNHRSIIFLCHSLGGIVCKQALALAYQYNETYGSLLESVIGITFLATPHRGSEAASLALAGTKPRIIRTDLLDHLDYNSKELSQLELDSQKPLEKMKIVSFYETELTPPLSNLIVDQTSAIINIDNEDVIPLYANHREICRFPADNSACQDVCGALRRIAFRREKEKRKPVRTSTNSSGSSFSDADKPCMKHFDIFTLADYKRSLPKPIEGTCQWILVHPLYISWFDKAENALLWLTGYPGCGKTVMSFWVAGQLENEFPNVLVYFCDDRINTQRDARAILIGLIAQLVHRHRAMGANVLSSFSALWSIFEKMISDLKSSTLYIIIDALDECEGSSCRELLGSIHDLVNASNYIAGSSGRVKFMVTSRPTLGQPYNYLREHQFAIDEQQPGHEEDIRIFIQKRVEEITHRNSCSEASKTFLLEALLPRADQTFMWIHMVLASLERSPLASIHDFRNIITKLPPDLENTYIDFVSAIPSHYQNSASQLLRLLFGSPRTLLLDEINAAFTIKPSHHSIEEVLRDCQPAIDRTILGVMGPLVRISGSKVFLIHQTVKDFLLMSDVTVETSALSIATACIEYLLLSSFSDDLYAAEYSSVGSSYGSSQSNDEPSEIVSSVGSWDDDVPNFNAGLQILKSGALYVKKSKAIASKYSLYRFSSLYWAECFAVCEASAPEKLRLAAASLLDSSTMNCQNWLRFYSAEVADSPSDIHSGSNPMALAAYFNLQTILVDFLHSGSSSQLEKDQALYWGALSGHSRIVTTMLEAGADPNRIFKVHTALMAAAARGHMECVVRLLDSGRCNLNMKDELGWGALTLAAINDHQDIFKYLLDRGDCDIDGTDISGFTPLMWAAIRGYVAVVSTLAKHPGVNINRRDNFGLTAISWAASKGMDNVLKCLLKLQGIDANLQDNLGGAPLSRAASYGHAGAVKILLRSKQVDTDTVDRIGMNAISCACEHGHEDALRVMLKHGCRGFDDPNVRGETPLARAVEQGHLKSLNHALQQDHLPLSSTTSSIWFIKAVGAAANFGTMYNF
ncbi:hypothetical protein F4777DRAFT_587643 [Nemania sp. FL0916]|nr:hypothetical protein F4777DRAFT_587643 [Nemania sp. FL0916]